MSATEAVPAAASAGRLLPPVRFGATLIGIGLLLFGVPWWTLFVSGTPCPAAVVAAGTVLSLGTLLTFWARMVAGCGPRHLDWAARTATRCWAWSKSRSRGRSSATCAVWASPSAA